VAKKKQKHDFDIVECPVADDAVVSRMTDYLDGIVLKEDFLQELSFYKKTHQICFCTVKSLLLLKNLNGTENGIFPIKFTHFLFFFLIFNS
jgi:hypothetical protein